MITYSFISKLVFSSIWVGTVSLFVLILLEDGIKQGKLNKPLYQIVKAVFETFIVLAFFTFVSGALAIIWVN